MNYRRSDSPEFDPDAETDAAAADSDASAETVTIEVTKTPPARVLRSSQKRVTLLTTMLIKTTTKVRKATQKRVEVIRGKIRLVLNLRKNVDAHAKLKANLFHLHCRFSEVYAEITSMNNAEHCTSLTNGGKAP